MKEFQKKIKTVVKRHTPDKERIRRAVKGEVSAAVTAPKAERSFSVGSLAAVAVMFILVTGIVIGSVLVEQTRKPAVSGVGNSDTETTNMTLPDPDAIDLNNVYPLNYQTSENIPLWEDRTTEEELAEQLNRKEITFADPELSFKKSETIEDVVWEAGDFDNVTTRELYDNCGCELVWIRGNIFVLDENTLYLATDQTYTERDANIPIDPFSLETGRHLLFVYYVPCSVGEKGGIMVHCSWYAFSSGKYDYSYLEMFFYDLAKKTRVDLFTSDKIVEEGENESYQFRFDIDLGVDLPTQKIALRSLAVEKRVESYDRAYYRMYAVIGEGRYIFDPNPIFVIQVCEYTHVGNLYYDGKRDVWSFDVVDPPNQSTESETESYETEPPETLMPELNTEITEQIVDVGYCSDKLGLQTLWDYSYLSPDESVYPVCLFQNASDLQQFYDKTKSSLCYDLRISSAESFSDLVNNYYGNDYFNYKSLLVLYVPLTSQSYRTWALTEVTDEGMIHLTVRRDVPAFDFVLWGRFLVLEVDSKLEWLKGITVNDDAMDINIP